MITRLREGDRPAFPPSRRDALILGGTVFDLLERHAGPDACVRMVSRLHRDGPRGNLELAFEARMRDIERAWRMHLDEILYPQSDSRMASRSSDALERPDLDLDLGSPPEFSFDPTTPAALSRTRDRRGRRPRRQLRRPRSARPRAARRPDPRQ